MNQKNLYILLIIFFLLGGIYWISSDDQRENGPNSEQVLFPDLAKEAQISKIKLEKGAESLELVLDKDVWVLPSRALYAADEGKVTALLLKVLGLSVSQLVTADQEKFEVLGVADNSIKTDHIKISFFDKAGKELSGLYLGESRKSREDAQMPMRFGQYIRRLGQDNVYLVKDPINVQVDVSSWLKKGLLNISSTNLQAVSQVTLENDTETSEFDLISEKKGSLKLKDPVAADQEVQESVLSMIAGGLENLNIDDVLKSEDPTAADLQFNRKTIYKLDNALVYTVLTAEKEGKGYLKIKVDFDQSVADAAQAEYEAKEKARKEEEDKKAKAELSGEKSGEDQTSKEEQPVAAVVKPNISTKDKAEELNNQYKSWIYQIPEFSIKKFRQSKGDLVKAKVVEKEKEEEVKTGTD